MCEHAYKSIALGCIMDSHYDTLHCNEIATYVCPIHLLVQKCFDHHVQYILGYVKYFWLGKVQIFWEGNKNLAHLPLFFEITKLSQIISGRWAKFLQPSQNVWTPICQFILTHSIWQIRPLFSRSKWNKGEILAFLA